MLSYRKVAQSVKVFWEGKDAVQDNLCKGQSHMENNTVHLLASLLDADRWLTARKLAVEVWVCNKTMLLILHDILGYRILAACWISHEISKVQQWHCYAVTQALFPCSTSTEEKVTTFLDKSWL